MDHNKKNKIDKGKLEHKSSSESNSNSSSNNSTKSSSPHSDKDTKNSSRSELKNLSSIINDKKSSNSDNEAVNKEQSFDYKLDEKQKSYNLSRDKRCYRNSQRSKGQKNLTTSPDSNHDKDKLECAKNPRSHIHSTERKGKRKKSHRRSASQSSDELHKKHDHKKKSHYEHKDRSRSRRHDKKDRKQKDNDRRSRDEVRHIYKDSYRKTHENYSRHHSPHYNQSRKYHEDSRKNYPFKSLTSENYSKKTTNYDKSRIPTLVDIKTDICPKTFQKNEDSMKTKEGGEEKKSEVLIPLPSYYNPLAVNPVKYAERMQKRKLLWGGGKKKIEGDNDPNMANITGETSNIDLQQSIEKNIQIVPNIENKTFEAKSNQNTLNSTELYWKNTAFSENSKTEKFRKLMGIKKSVNGNNDENNENLKNAPVLTEEEKKRRKELYQKLNEQYEIARMSTHTLRGMGLGFASANTQFENT